jgi:hypothetical protein
MLRIAKKKELGLVGHRVAWHSIVRVLFYFFTRIYNVSKKGSSCQCQCVPVTNLSSAKVNHRFAVVRLGLISHKMSCEISLPVGGFDGTFDKKSDRTIMIISFRSSAENGIAGMRR